MQPCTAIDSTDLSFEKAAKISQHFPEAQLYALLSGGHPSRTGESSDCDTVLGELRLAFKRFECARVPWVRGLKTQTAKKDGAAMDLETHDIVGGTGAAILLVTYLMLQINRISAQSMLYSQLNALGSALILASLFFDFNLSAFMIEACWLVISCIGAAVTLKNRLANNGVSLVSRRKHKDSTKSL